MTAAKKDNLAEAGSVDFSVEELVTLSSLLGHRLLPALGDQPLGVIDDESDALIRSTAMHSLIARRIVDPSDVGLTVLPAVSAVLEVGSYPNVLGRAEFGRVGVIETRFYSVRPELAIEHAPLVGAIHRITPFDTKELLRRIFDFTHLEARPDCPATGFEVTGAQLQMCIDAVLAGDPSKARDALVDAGAESSSADSFVEALTSGVGSARVTFLHRLEDNQVAGGELSWLDGNDRGLWLTPALETADSAELSDSEAASVTVTIEPTNASWIASELLSYLPHGQEE